ncbi:hypothetical protein [Henriciella marina]|uniref:Uncharacterized protein n=1 Tax=Henriciella marina TaxID=453851 RepID=A0ABT4LVU7_9PROT|nr:hypothetical protein [Henriciella marina]MCZ4298283.1 hypothetical protein [Henriciella marina]
MSAVRKTVREPDGHTGKPAEADDPRPEAACSERHEGAQSPARRLQDDLHDRLVPEHRSSTLRQIAQALVTASGLTMVMGFFVFNAIS